ncbi:MAG: hypothetical protein GF411_01490 [Candidatus Lokiarchaeota archaeon]|nr:hypothetical protein [Candidatus Lokiarchaeota archaeon]
MGVKHRIMKSIILRFGIPRIKRMMEKQKAIQDRPDAIRPTANSPTRFEIPLEMMNLISTRDDIEMKHMLPVRRLLSVMKNIHRSVDSLEENPMNPKISITSEEVTKLEEYAQGQGVSSLGYVKLPQNLIFQKFGVIYENAIILTMEMSKEKIDKAPSQSTMNMVFKTYDELGQAGNQIAEYLRIKGYAAQADHPLGGLVLFPPLAQLAGLGWIGKHGLLITPKYGPRVRLAAVYTSIANLSIKENNEHDWIADYCALCGRCIKECPPQAILEDTVVHESGLVTNIRQQECFEYFGQYYGCSICVKVCPFSRSATMYQRLKKVTQR